MTKDFQDYIENRLTKEEIKDIERQAMDDLLEQQMVNELRALLKQLNDKYNDFFHFSVLTLVDMEDEQCDSCKEHNKKCIRAVIGTSSEETCS